MRALGAILLPQVIVMERMWKSGVEREALQYLRPNPFFVGVVRTLIQEQEVSKRF